MNADYKSGYIQAYTEMKAYAASMIPEDSAHLPWTDMALYAHTSIEDISEEPEDEHPNNDNS